MTGSHTEVAALGPDAVLLTLSGPLGALDIDDLRAAAEPLTAATVVVDATAASIDDSGVLEVVLDLARERVARGGRVVVAAAPSSVLGTVLEATGLDVAVALHPSLEAALAELGLPAPGDG